MMPESLTSVLVSALDSHETLYAVYDGAGQLVFYRGKSTFTSEQEVDRAIEFISNVSGVSLAYPPPFSVIAYQLHKKV